MAFPVFDFPMPPKSQPILNGNVLDQIFEDIAQRMNFPSWVEPPPKDLGTKRCGKLTAHQWRNLATIFLVFTLVNLWGNGSPELKDRLDNFMSLVIATRYATKRRISAQDIAIVEDHLVKYLEGLVKLYPAHDLTINHHMSLHLPQFLRRLGPTHSWWTFPFERFNGIIQQINNNSKLGNISLSGASIEDQALIFFQVKSNPHSCEHSVALET